MESRGQLTLTQAAGDEKIQAFRRRLVAALRLRGLTIYEIIDALANNDPPCVNPETGEPWSKSVISKDLLALKAQWREEALGDIGELIGREVAKNEEAERRAWEKDDIGSVLRAQEIRYKLLGLNAPVKVAPTNAAGESLAVQIGSLNFEQLKLLQSLGFLGAPEQPVPAGEQAAG